tara:strand:- start:85 stop:453 length:369 start_codon:yes stop_codon:yes gene_type:complete
MWQLKKLSTNEGLSEAGPLPNNWGPIFGLEGFKEKLGDLSWIGPDYVDQGWVELTSEEQALANKSQVLARIEAEKTIANAALNEATITIDSKIAWDNYLTALEVVSLSPDFKDPQFPVRPSA